MGSRIDMYMPVYEKIEKEIIELSSNIFFVDELAKVYSLNIADLIIRCAIEIESLIKDVYRKEKGCDPKSPGDCLTWMDSEWNLSKKTVSIISPYFHFESLKEFAPFDYKKNSEDDYYSIYNAIKHDRVKNIKKANLHTLIRIVGALFILNVIYRGEKIYLDRDRFGNKLDRTGGSKIFSFLLAPCPDVPLLSSQEKINKDTCLYKIVRKESDFSFRIKFKDSNGEIDSINAVSPNELFQKYAKSCIGKKVSEDEFWTELDKMSEIQMKDDFYLYNKVIQVISITAEKMEASYWAELNI